MDVSPPTLFWIVASCWSAWICESAIFSMSTLVLEASSPALFARSDCLEAADDWPSIMPSEMPAEMSPHVTPTTSPSHAASRCWSAWFWIAFWTSWFSVLRISRCASRGFCATSIISFMRA